MKTRVLYLFAALITLVSCTNEKVTTVISDSDEFYCSIENEESTRTSLDQNNNVTWSAEDQLVIFKKSSIPSKYQISESHVGKTSGSFYKINSDEFNAGSELDHNVALYPYQENIEITKLDSDSPTSSYKITGYNFPSEQTYVENSFANGAFPMAAVSDNYDLTFRNICGGIKLKLKGTQKVVSVKIEGKNNEKLSGAAIVTAYTDETKPAITMTSTDASAKSVTLNCGTGVQLSESTATEFIIALPPVLFSQGFTVTVTEDTDKTYTVETDNANTVLRSSLLVMPTVKIAETPEVDSGDEDDDETVVPVTSVKLNQSSLTLPPSFSYTLTATITPFDATVQTATWSSSNASVATVDQNGVVVAVSDGTATITAEAGGVTATCTFTAIAPATDLSDYIDEYGVNHGKGIALGDKVWAPVNCGYHATDFPYGKHYQWGRKYGQGLSGSYDSSTVTVTAGPVSSDKETYADYFFTASEYPYDWVSPSNDALWNSGTEDSPVKTGNDPCPEGWRVPTDSELSQLAQNHSGRISSEKGLYFSGDYTYIDGVPRLFLPASGFRHYRGGWLSYVGDRGYYWSVTPYSYYAYYLIFFSDGNFSPFYNDGRARGYAVRCLQE